MQIKIFFGDPVMVEKQANDFIKSLEKKATKIKIQTAYGISAVNTIAPVAKTKSGLQLPSDMGQLQTMTHSGVMVTVIWSAAV